VALLALASCAPLPPGPTPIPQAPAPAPGPGAPPAAPAAPAGPLVLESEPLITVGLAWDRDTLIVTPVDDLVAADLSWPGGRNLPARGPLRLSVSHGGVRVEASRAQSWQTAFVTAARETAWIANVERGGVSVRWSDKQWRGAIGVFVNPRGSLTLVSRLPLESYLLDVVPGEIGALGEDRIEAGRAQAIAARSYTLFYRGRRASEGFDLYATVEDQVFGPIESERPLATRCVSDTRGRLALAAGQPIRANYCSTCGGISAEVWEAWPSPSLSYLRSHRDRGHGEDYCAASAHYRWRETWTADEFMANVARFGPSNGLVFPSAGLGDLVDVAVGARSRSGRVWRLRITTTTGTLELPAYVIRQVLRRGAQPGAILRSNLFKIAVRRDPVTRAARAVIASGAGSGHGVGLCQTGALGMALAGEKAAAILEHYYPGVEVRQLYR
jgi:stage II sporulation protein D